MPVDFSRVNAPIPETPSSQGLSFVGDALDAIMARRHAVEQAKLQREQAHLHAQMVDARTRDVAKFQQESNDENRRLRIAMYGETLEDKARTQRRLAAESAPKVAGQLGTASLAETLPEGEGARIMTDYQARMKEDEDRDRLRGEPRSNSSWYTPGGNAGSGAAVVEPRPAVQAAPAVPEEGGSLDEPLTLPGPVPTVQAPPPEPPPPPPAPTPHRDFMSALAETMNPGGAFSRSPPPPTPESADPPVEAPPPPLPSSKTVLPNSSAAAANVLRLEEETAELKQDIPGEIKDGARRLLLGEDYQKVYTEMREAHDEWQLRLRAARNADAGATPETPPPPTVAPPLPPAAPPTPPLPAANPADAAARAAGQQGQTQAQANVARFEQEAAGLKETNPGLYDAGIAALKAEMDYTATLQMLTRIAKTGGATPDAPATPPPAAPVPPVSPTVPAVDPAQAAGRKAGGYNFPSRKDLVERFTETTKELAKKYPDAYQEGVAHLWNTGDSKGAMKVFERAKDREADLAREVRTRESRQNDISAEGAIRNEERRVEAFGREVVHFETQNNVKETTDAFDKMRSFKASVEGYNRSGDTVGARSALYSIARYITGPGVLQKQEYDNTVSNTSGWTDAIATKLAKFQYGKIGEGEWKAIELFVKNAQREVRQRAIKAVRLFDTRFGPTQHYGKHVPEEVKAVRDTLKLRFGLDEDDINPPPGGKAKKILEQLNKAPATPPVPAGGKQ